MENTSPFLLAVLSLLGGGTLGALLTQYFNRKKTGAETLHVTAQTGREEAEASKVWTQQIADLAAEMREGVKNVQATNQTLSITMREKTEAEIRARECEAEGKRLEAYAEGLRVSLVEEQRLTTELRGKLREAMRE